jgi:hypothetical protein
MGVPSRIVAAAHKSFHAASAGKIVPLSILRGVERLSPSSLNYPPFPLVYLLFCFVLLRMVGKRGRACLPFAAKRKIGFFSAFSEVFCDGYSFDSGGQRAETITERARPVV